MKMVLDDMFSDICSNDPPSLLPEHPVSTITSNSDIGQRHYRELQDQSYKGVDALSSRHNDKVTAWLAHTNYYQRNTSLVVTCLLVLAWKIILVSLFFTSYIFEALSIFLALSIVILLRSGSLSQKAEKASTVMGLGNLAIYIGWSTYSDCRITKVNYDDVESITDEIVNEAGHLRINFKNRAPFNLEYKLDDEEIKDAIMKLELCVTPLN